MQKHFPKSVEAFGVQMTNPGEEAELDFGHLGKLPGVGGKLVKTWGLAIVLSYSQADALLLLHKLLFSNIVSIGACPVC